MQLTCYNLQAVKWTVLLFNTILFVLILAKSAGNLYLRQFKMAEFC